MRTSRIAILIIAVATLAAVIPPGAVPVEEKELLFVVWGMPFEDRLFRDGYARGFEELHPEWSVEYQRHMANIVSKYKAWHVLGRGPDVMRLPIPDYHAMIELGAIEPLDRFIDDAEVGLSQAERSDFFPFLWETLEVDGRRYALPSDNAQFGLYYNRSIFDAYNEAHPEAPVEYPSAEWTWDDLLRASDALEMRSADGEITIHGIAFDLSHWPFLSFLRQAGGRIWDESETTTHINSPEGVEAMEFLVSLVPPDAPVRSPELAESAVGPSQLFKLGKVAMLLDGSWWAPNFEKDNPDLDFAIAPLSRRDRRAVMTGSVLWAISSHSEHKEMAWRMIKWMTSREQSLRYWETLRVAPPARMSVVTSPEFRSTTGLIDEDGRVWVPPMTEEEYPDRAAWLEYAITPDPETGERPGFVPATPYQADLERKISSAIVAVVRGDATPRQALDDAARAVHEIIDRDRRSRGLPPVDRDGE